ncbi:MAG: hypothetical protein CFE48_04025 [Pseudomonas sp. PGPPP2]|nr:MAG: hypothetical protein CFE48_04025 [Pseudomonas sp. PGPPP2]
MIIRSPSTISRELRRNREPVTATRPAWPNTPSGRTGSDRTATDQWAHVSALTSDAKRSYGQGDAGRHGDAV